MKRSKHSLSHYVLSTFDMGQLVPVANFEVLPGDSVRMSTSALIRVSPLMAPVMHPVTVRLHHWFVPYRILWDGFEDFITGGPDGTGADDPFPTAPMAGFIEGPGFLGDFMGLPNLGTTYTNGLRVSALPFAAYSRIWNEFYRDQDLQAEIGDDVMDPGSFNAAVQNIAWEKDYFTAARPWTQKGPDVTIPIAGTATVHGAGKPTFMGGVGPVNLGELQENTQEVQTQFASSQTPPIGLQWNDPALSVDLTGATAIGVNDVRMAFALQRYQEARAAYGSRYTEYLRYLGVRSSDARLQRPEYLGGGRTTLNFSEVLRTGNDVAADDESPIGEMRGHGIGAVRSRRWIRFFEEHGIVLTLASVRPRSMYANGADRMWFRTSKEDFWQQELEQIGQQEVYNREVYTHHPTPDGIFGYNDRYAEYRHKQSYVTNEFRNIMSDWHLARSFASAPALNSDFIECVPSKRIHAEQTQNTLWGMFSHSIQARRMVGKKVIGRIF